MNNKNSLYLILGSAGLIGIYTLLMNTVYAPPKPKPGQAAPAQPQTSAPEAPAAPQAATPAPAPASTPAAAPQAAPSGRTLRLENDQLALTFRQDDGALVQAQWRKDGTPFFPEPLVKDGKEISKAFPGIGGALDTRFEGEPVVATVPQGRTVTFQTAAGDRLEYRIPDQGHVLEVSWASPRGAHLSLLRKPKELLEVAGLGKVHAIQDKGITSVEFAGMLKDPWFGKRKELPEGTSRLGLDAGVNPGVNQSTHYFTALWEMNQTPERDASLHPGYHMAPVKDGVVKGRLYLGPKQQEALKAFGEPYLRVIDFGMFGLIAKGMFWVLHLMNRAIPNWGWTIIIFSLLLRFALWGLNTKQTVSMLRMKDLEPHQKALQAKYEKFGNDMTKKAEMQKELMAFYKKNGHNPMGSCLPMLLQMPIFMALWGMLQNVFELHKAPFHGWITDLSAKDPIFVLPVLLAASMFIQSKMSPAVGDESQRKMMMYMMPAMMLFMFANMPAGLNLYYLVFNLVGLFQTWVVMRNYKPQPVIL